MSRVKPGLDPSNPPVFVMTRTEHDLYAKLRDDFSKLPDLDD